LVGKLRRRTGGQLERTNSRTPGAGAGPVNLDILGKGMSVSDQTESSAESPLLSPPVVFFPPGFRLRSHSCSNSSIQDKVGELALVGRRCWNIRRGSYQGSDGHVILQQGTNQQVQETLAKTEGNTGENYEKAWQSYKWRN